ncbi:hypothetical protein BCR36DRAFT_373659 [Piromyces finnis]|uniref:Uncharacterized protein n=1 Tax=Piromyces finnis TaxID=1754191 RepID=A0A1Y1V162_9FUNG|nr:hypothetical protein BCR36DRAFT_373659 [Piromyces finnis]|eukprot:ORX43758.1 hypothetical protein BCR36DRAFT_373659 [Piromyces finnis]
MMNSVIREINNVTWVNKDEQQQIINIFISEVTFRYSKMESFIRKISKNPDNYNQLLKQMFIRLNNIKDEILDFCLQRKNRLDKIGIFNEKTNIDRVLTEFRTELRRKMDEEMWYLQTNNKLKEEKEKNEKRELTFEEKFKNEFNDMNQQLSELKGSPVDLVIPPIIDEINSKKKSKELKEEINKIIIKEISEEKKISDTEHQKYLKSVIKKRKEMFKEDFDKAEKSYKSDDDDENFNKVHDNKVTEYKDIEQDLTKLSNREYEQNREYVKRKGIKLQYLTIDDDNVDKEKSLSLSEKIKNLFNNLKNHSDYNLLIGRTLIDSHLKDIKEDLKDEYTNEMYEKIKNINNKYEWKTLFNSDNTLENELYGNEDEILNNNLLQYKLYPFNRPKKIYKPEKKEEEIKILQEKYDDTILNDLNFDTTTPMRIHGLMRSENDDVGLWKIDTTLDIMCKFENPNELERHKDLDEKLNMNKEAENLYKEISKFILHKDSDFHDLESENKIIAAPSCYLDDENKILFSNCNEQIIVFDSEKEKREKEIKKETPEKIDYKPTIKLLTHKAGKFHVNADKYYRNRSKAMKLTQSSKYESLEYNFGGYIPAYVIKKKKDKMKNETILTMDEYKKYVINLRCDFLHDIIIKDSIEKQRRSDEKYYHGLLRKELKNHDEKSQIKLFKNKYKKYKYKSHEIRNTKDGYWNPEVLDYMNALSRQKIIGNIKGLDINNGNSKNINTNILTNDKKKENQVNANDSDKNSGNENSIESKDNNKSKDSISSKEIYESKRTIETKENSESNENESKNNNDSNKSRGTTAISKSSWDEEGYDDVDDDINLPPNPCNSYVNSDDELSDTISKYFTLNNNIDKPYESIESGTYMTLPSMQEAMECIFDRLKMPVNEKIDLAIKYGSYEFSMKFIEAISCWNIVSKLIIKREEKLDRIREFETKISNPYRFFKSGESSLITARFVEDLQRKDFVKDLEPLNKRIIKLCIKIYKKYGDVIKYEGKPYIEKIKNDYSNIIKHAYREFEKKQNEVPYSLKF